MLIGQSTRSIFLASYASTRRHRRRSFRRWCTPEEEEVGVYEEQSEVEAKESPEESQQQVYVLESVVMSSVRPIQYPSWYGASENFIFTALILLAMKLGHLAANQHRYDNYGIQTTMDGMVDVSKELAAKRKNQQEAEALMKEQEAKKRMESALKQAKEEAAKKKERELKYQAEQEKEIKRLQAERQKQKEVFEEQERRMQTELEKRMEVEKKIQQEMEEKRRAEAAEKLRVEAEQRRLELERQASAEAERQRQVELEKQKQKEEKQALDKLKKLFAVRMEGEISIARAAVGTTTTKPPTQQALLTVSFDLKPSISDEITSLEDHFADIEDALDSIGKLIGFVCHGAMDSYLSNVRIQSMTGTGPLTLIDEEELSLFGSFACLHAYYQTEKIAQRLINDFNQSGAVKDVNEALQVRTEWGVLPHGHEKRLDSSIKGLFQQLIGKELDLPNLNEKLQKLVASEQKDQIEKHNMKGEFEEAIEANLLAHIHDRALSMKDSMVYDSVVPLLQELLSSTCKNAKIDSLLTQSIALESILGEGHPIALWFRPLAEKNMSLEKRQAAIEKQRRMEAIMKAKLLEQQWPDRKQISAELLKEREESTPIPERVWAMRNVSKTLLMGSAPTEAALNQAKDLISKALALQRQYCNSPNHPGLLGCLKDQAAIEARIDPEQAAFFWEEIVNVLGELCERYRRQGDLFSAALCAETGVINGESFLDARHPVIKKLGKASEALFNPLNEMEKKKFLEVRKSGNGLMKIIESFTSPLDAYKTPGKVDRLEQWTRNESLDPISV